MNRDLPILTIGIPTYNRAAKLQAQLERLVPQLTSEVRVCVYDNASPDNTREVAAKFPGVGYFRAATNCGMSRNFFRCFEECQTIWLWMLSDDDLATPTAVADLLAILRNESADFIHTSFWLRAYSDKTAVVDLPSFFQHSKNIGDLLWITAGIYRINSFRPLFRIFNDAMFTWGPHLVAVLALLESNGGKARLVNLQLTVPKPEYRPAWSTLDCMLRLSLLPEFLNKPEHQKILAERVFLDFFVVNMLMGLRETAEKQQIHKWKRIHGQVRQNMKAYQMRWLPSHGLDKWYRAGHRKTSLHLAKQIIQVKVLFWCPAFLFHYLIRLMPLPEYIRNDFYNKRHEYRPYV